MPVHEAVHRAGTRTHPSLAGRPIRCSRYSGSVACISRRMSAALLVAAPALRCPVPAEIPNPHSLQPEAANVVLVEGALGAVVEDRVGVQEHADRGDVVVPRPACPVETRLPPTTCHGWSGSAMMMRSSCTRGLRSTTTSNCARSMLWSASATAARAPVIHGASDAVPAGMPCGTSRANDLRKRASSTAASVGERLGGGGAQGDRGRGGFRDRLDRGRREGG